MITLKIQSAQDFDAICEDWDPETKEVRYTTFYRIDDDDFAVFGKIPKRQTDIVIEEFISALVHIPDDQIYPRLPADSSLTIASELFADPVDKVYIKRPNLAIYDLVQDSTFLSDLLLSEARVMEIIAQHPHPNIVRYRGVRVRRGRITGILLDKHKDSLLNHLREGRPLKRGAFIAALGSAVAHLHSTGLVHNDLNPENIMIDGEGMPILIDFGSCQPPGKRLLTLGTPGWTRHSYTHSDPDNDLFALGKLVVWLESPKFD